jgi:hypothetical protein
MPLVFVFLATLCAADVVGRDGGVPPWAPTLKPAQAESTATYALRKWGKGFVWEDSKFEARVSRDGVVTFKDKRLWARVGGSGWNRKLRGGDAAPSVQGPPFDPALSRRGPWLQPPTQPNEPTRRMPPEEVCPPGSSCYVLPNTSMLEVSGGFDLTDEILRGLGHDPYALDKAHFLSATFEFRIKLAIEAQKLAMQKALDQLPARLDELWSDGRYSARERRRILYELWSELDSTPEGERAARIMDDFIRKRLPCGSPETYTGAELEGFTKTRGERRFAPTEDCAKTPGIPRH